MDMNDCYMLEDVFPKSFAQYEEKPYGILFYNTENKDSFDSNHAVIYRDKISDLSYVLKDILSFYKEKGLKAIIYQSSFDSGYFMQIKDELSKAGFESWIEEQNIMMLTAENKIIPNGELTIRQIKDWENSLVQIFEEAEEPWETEVAKKALKDPNTYLWAAYLGDKPIGVLYCLTDGKVSRGNYVLVSKKHRNVGAGRTLCHHYIEWCREKGIPKVFHWPAGEHPEKIYNEGGFRHVETLYAGRAVYRDR